MARLNQEKRDKICTRLSELYQDVLIELDYETDYQLLVAVVLSAQATDKGVNKATKVLFSEVKEAKDIIALPFESLVSMIRSIGLYQTKAKNVMALSHMLVSEYAGQVPNTMEELIQLPGVGRKTANVVLNVLFGLPTIAVDTHVFRVSNRLGLSNGKTPDQVEADLVKKIDAKYKQDLHLWLIHHGRYVCKAQRPMCQTCHLIDLCGYKHKSI